MSLIPFKHWTSWPWILIIGSMQIYIIYSSICRYVNLKYKVFNGSLLNDKNINWILTLLNYQLLAIIISLGILPLWFYSTLFSSSSFFCGRDLLFTKKGFYKLVWNEAVDVLYKLVHSPFDDVEHIISKPVKVAAFFPISNVLHILMAYLLLLPIPFMDAWLIHSNDGHQESIWSSDIEFFGSRNFIIKIKCSVEYFNFFFSLLNISFQFPKLLWPCNKFFSLFLNIIQLFVTFHILISFSLFSIFIKYYYKHLLINNIFTTPCFILIITTISDCLLILTSFSYFQFGFEKCVQYLLRSSWFNSINRSAVIPLTNNYEHSNCQSTTSSSAYFSSRNVIHTKHRICPILSSAGFFILAIVMRTLGCYEYWYHLRGSPYFMIHFINSLVLIISYFMMWFGMCLKPNWIFTVNERKLTQYAIITYPEKVELNDYKSLRSQQGNSQISLSVVSNTNYSNQSKKRELLSKVDVTMNHEQYLSQCTSLPVLSLHKSNIGSNEYLKLNHQDIQSNVYKSIYGNNTLNGSRSPTNNNSIYKDFKRTSTSNFKCSTPPSYSILRPNESVHYSDSVKNTRKLSMGFSIQEELYNETDISSEEEAMGDEQMRNNSQFKFVTFQLDKNPKISPDLNSSNDNLTIGSLDTSEKFIKELERGTDIQIGYTNFRDNKNLNENLGSLSLLENTSANNGRIKKFNLKL